MSQWMRPYKCTMKRQFAECLITCIEQLIVKDVSCDDDRLHFAILGEIKDRVFIKLLKPKTEFGITLTPAQAIALRVLYTDYFNNPITYLGNKLHAISVEVAQQYN